ncbi:hypothetical protein ABGB16_12160 [Micromonospora sp. B11E3]|uniref:hypothetical protein n=1 Tax=Micromonospora sp. B11E3 TaxID=3153562 RepID=UPI00325CADBF
MDAPDELSRLIAPGAGAEGSGAEAALAALGRIPEARALLDDAERRLIDEARRQGATWAQVAGALALTSRQAAEQRRSRLGPASDEGKRAGGTAAGAEVTAVRAAVSGLVDALDADAGWERRFPRAALARATLRAALPAPPGALLDLTAQALDDVAGAAPARLPRPVRTALDRLRRATREARPAPRKTDALDRRPTAP